MIHREADCQKCGERFIMTYEDDLVHLTREDGEECGGQGVYAGAWVPVTAADMGIAPVRSTRQGGRSWQ